MDYSTKFINTAEQLIIIAESVNDLIAQRKQQQRTLFESFKDSLLEALKGNSEDWQIVVKDGFSRLDEVTLKTLLSAKTSDGQKVNTLWRADKGFSLKPSKINQDSVNLVECLLNPFETEKEVRPPKGEFEKMASALKAVINRLDKVDSANPMMKENLENYLKFYQKLIEADKEAGEIR